MSKKALLFVLLLYVSSAALTYAILGLNGRGGVANTQNPGDSTSQLAQEEEEASVSKLLTIDPSATKDQVCPLNGAYFTQAEKDAWSKKRPLAVMIENHPDARPQSGLSHADVVFEAMAEGGVTRFMSIFYCAAQAEDIKLAPVRSARSYFIEWASGFYRPLYAHVGGANLPGPANALGQLSDYDWKLRNDIDAMSVGYPTYVRDYSRLEGKEDLATEHTMVSSTDKLWKVAEKRGWTNIDPLLAAAKKPNPKKPAEWSEGYVSWQFSDEGSDAGDDAPSVSYEFWPGYKDYTVKWEYDSSTKMYKRVMAGQPHVDLNNNKQLAVRNVVVLLTEEKGPIDEKKHLLYGTTGKGNAVVIQNGKAQKVTWSKKDRESPLMFQDAKGKDVVFARGPIWISVLGKKMEVTY